MGNLWLGLLIAGIVLVCIVVVLALRHGGLFGGAGSLFIGKRPSQDVYDPLLMLEDMGLECLSLIGEKGIELIFDIDKMLPAKLCGDAERIRKVIMSLLQNAIGFAEKGYVRLLVKIYPVVENEMIEMYVSVKDTGKGIRQEKMKRLFAFRGKFHFKDRQGLVGNGLFVSQRLVKRMGGEIRAKSEEGKGSEFWFSVQQGVADPIPGAKLPEKGRTPRVSAKFCNAYREEALMSLLNMYKVSFIPYDILQDVGMTVDYLFTDHNTYYEIGQEMAEFVMERENICVLENPLRDHKKLEGVTIVYRPLFSLNFCRHLGRAS